MRWVDQPPFGHPGCAVIAGRGRDGQGFIESGNVPPGARDPVYVSAAAVAEMARILGFSTPEEAEELRERLGEAQARNDRLEEELADQDTVIQAIDVFESAGFRARKKPGRKPKVESEAA